MRDLDCDRDIPTGGRRVFEKIKIEF